MKRGPILFFLFAVGSLAGIYFIIPNSLVITKVSFFNAPPAAVFRHLTDTARWKNWWPTDQTKNESLKIDIDGFHNYRKLGFKVDKLVHDAAAIEVRDSDSTFGSQVSVLSAPGDSTVVQWTTHIEAAGNPWARVRAYQKARMIKSGIEAVLSALQTYLQKPENLYGQLIRETSTRDTLLIATKASFNSQPKTEEIYHLIDELKAYSSTRDAKQTGFPMLNISKNDSNRFQVMVALPINKWLTGNKDFFPRRLIPGKFMTSEITGGYYRVEEAISEMNNYFSDYKKTAMAIRFQSLITDRRNEPDSNKWVTKIYAPVF